MYKVLVFAGTTEGYEICRFLADHRVQTKGFVATEYGSKSLTENEFLTVQTGRLDAAAMEETFFAFIPTENSREPLAMFHVQLSIRS